MRLVSDGTLSPALGQFLSTPLNDAQSALGAPGDPAGAKVDFESNHDAAKVVNSGSSRARAAIRDLEDFILRVQMAEIFGQLKRSEARVLIDAAESIIKELRSL